MLDVYRLWFPCKQATAPHENAREPGRRPQATQYPEREQRLRDGPSQRDVREKLILALRTLPIHHQALRILCRIAIALSTHRSGILRSEPEPPFPPKVLFEPPHPVPHVPAPVLRHVVRGRVRCVVEQAEEPEEGYHGGDFVEDEEGDDVREGRAA